MTAKPAKSPTLTASKMSIKVKLTVWFTLVTFILFVAVQGFMLIIDGASVVDDAGDLLVSEVQRNMKKVSEGENGKPDVGAIKFSSNGVYISVYDKGGRFLSGAVPFELEETFQSGVTRRVSGPEGGYLLYDSYVELSSGGVWVRGLTPADSSDTLWETMKNLSAYTLPLVITLGALGGYLVATGALKPIRRITEAAGAINDGNDLSLRIGLGSPGSHDELQKLSDTFDSMFARLEKSFNDEQRFTSDVSHELRTPTTVILAECDYTRKHAQSPEDYKMALEVISRQAKKMSRLVESLLSLSRLDLGTVKANFEVGDLSEMLTVICSEMSLAGSRGITMCTDIESGISANMDVTLMSRLIQNLIDNAYKYGRDNGSVEVALRSEGRFAVLIVSDNGVGISKENLDKIWQRFYQEDSSRSGGEGLGLGLSMVKQIAQLHGGSVAAESAPGQGSTFTVKIPKI